MNILVTGGAGFMGSAFIRYLINSDLADCVVNYDRLTYAGNLSNLKQIEDNPKYRFEKGNIRDRKRVEEIVKKYNIDTIANFAAETHVDNSIESSQEFLKTNVEGTGVLLDVATNYNLRFHQVSTDEVFGSLDPGDEPFDERSPLDPKNPYSASKAGGDHLVMAYFNTYNTKVTITNCCNNYGPYHFREKLIPLFITNLLQDKKVPLYGDGRNIREWIHADDHASAVWTVLTKGKPGERYCVGTGVEKENIEIVKMLLDLTGKNESFIEYVPDRKGHDRRYATDFSKIKNELGWEPRINFEEGLEATVKWYRENEWWWKK